MASNRKKLYAEARLSGKNQKESAIFAGYSEATASQAASRLEKDKDVIAATSRISKFAKPVRTADPVKVVEPDPEPEVAPEPEIVKPEPEVVAPEPVIEQEEPEYLEQYSLDAVTDDAMISADPLEYMRRLMNNPIEDPKLRLDAAKALASFTVAKPGEKGKKEVQADRAKEVARKFSGLRAVK